MSSFPTDSLVRTLLAADEIDRATELAIRTHGPEIAGWLRSIFTNEADAQEAFSRMSEELWRSLQRFDGRCSIRTWCYMLARHAAVRERARTRHPQEVLFATIPSVVAAVTHVWNTTQVGAARADEVYEALRKEFDDKDQTLLVLRVDKNLAWREIALVLCGEDAATEAVERKASTLRKQFERIKVWLRERAVVRLRD